MAKRQTSRVRGRTRRRTKPLAIELTIGLVAYFTFVRLAAGAILADPSNLWLWLALVVALGGLGRTASQLWHSHSGSLKKALFAVISILNHLDD